MKASEKSVTTTIPKHITSTETSINKKLEKVLLPEHYKLINKLSKKIKSSNQHALRVVIDDYFNARS